MFQLKALTSSRRSCAQRWRMLSSHMNFPYKPGDQVWIDRALFRDAIAKTQISEKLTPKRYGPFTIVELIGKNALRLDFSSKVRLHPVIHVLHTTPFAAQPISLTQSVLVRSTPIPDATGEPLFEVSEIVKHHTVVEGFNLWRYWKERHAMRLFGSRRVTSSIEMERWLNLFMSTSGGTTCFLTYGDSAKRIDKTSILGGGNIVILSSCSHTVRGRIALISTNWHYSQ